MGVWIETTYLCLDASTSKSHPSWVCGLKLASTYSKTTRFASHPSWVCGLKPVDMDDATIDAVSHPSWVCGLKQGQAALMQGRAGHTLRGCVD